MDMEKMKETFEKMFRKKVVEVTEDKLFLLSGSYWQIEEQTENYVKFSFVRIPIKRHDREASVIFNANGELCVIAICTQKREFGVQIEGTHLTIISDGHKKKKKNKKRWLLELYAEKAYREWELENQTTSMLKGGFN